ncbi:hypothetical protein BDQ12DRAFT_198830 [Crucibulum laeve]|uniref:Uncharacterized protein n=1 Tax=Crucibulum laeve TaxID=68775 RepID=A0A5C3MF66_9AGAR|nr:hypothetical protein BDQ12DRAFT_198830 [Crucibulum laeve]
MAPSLRSTPSTPVKPSHSRDTTPSTTPRKIPQCTKCKRPRAGHPRSGCPYVDSPLKGTDIGTIASGGSDNITEALGSMYLESPVRVERDEETKAFIRNRGRSSSQRTTLQVAPTLEPLSAASSEIIAALLQPGMFDNDTDEDEPPVEVRTKAKVVRWQETLIDATSAKPRALMPGTLIAPSFDTSFSSSVTSPAKYETLASQKADSPSSLHAVQTPTPSQAPTTEPSQPLTRSMSLEQRELFISTILQKASATAYVLPKEDINAVAEAATHLNFHAQIAVNLNRKDDPEGLLILGRNAEEVKGVMDKVNEVQRIYLEKSGKAEGVSALRAAAGGVMVGAVGIFAGLAFS